MMARPTKAHLWAIEGLRRWHGTIILITGNTPIKPSMTHRNEYELLTESQVKFQNPYLQAKKPKKPNYKPYSKLQSISGFI